MKTIYLDLVSGISGDMFIGALLDLGLSFEHLRAELGKLGLEEFHLHSGKSTKSNIAGTKFDVHVGRHEHAHSPEAPEAQASPHAHSHSRPHGHEHEHEHGDEHGAEHEHSHSHRHVHSHPHSHSHDDPGHEHEHEHEHTPDLVGSHGHTHSHEHEHVHEHSHEHSAHEHGHSDSHSHAHGHKHEHEDGRSFSEIQALIVNSSLSDWVKQKAIAVFKRVATAEGRIHHMPPEHVTFHEVGAVDSIVDIVGACIGLEALGKPQVLSSSVTEGTGFINCAHGRFPIPAPATLAILAERRVPVSQCDEPNELVTPTGAALLAELAGSFGPLRDFVPERVGYGLGTRDNRTRPNVLRAVLGESLSSTAGRDWEIDTVAVLETNLDDVSGEVLGYVFEKALAAGALDVFYTPIGMKKNRPGTLLSILCEPDKADAFCELILRETTAFGVRRSVMERRKLRREARTVLTEFGPVAVKFGSLGDDPVQASPEYESCRGVAQASGVPVREVYAAALRASKTAHEKH